MSTELFAPIILSTTEQELVVQALSTLPVRKYLTALANETIREIAYGEPAVNETSESYLRRLALVKGRLEALNTLLQIQAAE
jgi:hypothetical protein